MLLSRAKDHKVVDTATATTVGQVREFVIDPSTAAVVALQLGHGTGGGDVLHWEDIQGFGPDVVTIDSVEVVGSARDRVAELIAGYYILVGKRVLTDAGVEIGVVEDVEFDSATGRVVELLTEDGPVAGDRLIGCGSYAVTVRAAEPPGGG